RGVKRNIRDIEITTSTTSDSLVTENGKHQSSKVKITSDSVFKDFNNSQGFLPSQVTSPFSPPWPHGPHQCPLYPTFYHILVYWGCMVPFWYTLETSTCLGKRTRDEALHDNVRENKDTFVRARLDSQSRSIDVATNNRVLYPVPMKREKAHQLSFSSNGFETKSCNNRFVPKTYLNLQTNPADMSRSINFRESM
ncbi:hypothetical protein HID58_034844, partial [Brassica napus]